ncbi:hypothetical protein [Burkholderia ambifaria]|uniref:hypothetical protein n=1 Tax=Burkholderia ambifaria TaxID=152480 RepID=UPI0015888830|nr:hypothetical protein [Burkholderia ambifaria]MBR8344691.1 hypothetical protein [Burkholderia ambifaria]
MNATQIKAIKEVVKSGFTYAGDSIFTSVRAGRSAINALVANEFLKFEANEFGGQYVPTSKARDYVTFGPHSV